MAQYIIPTIFTASDQMSRPMAAIQSSFQSMGKAVTETQARMVSLQSIVGEDVNNRIKFMVSLAKGMAVIGLATGSARALMEYSDAVQEFRIIVSDLNEMDFSRFKNAARDIAMATNTSAANVVKMFTAVAGLDDRLAATPELLGKVTRAAITMQRGGLMQADMAARALVTTLSQFGYGAAESDRVINAFAAGQNRGAFTIQQTTEALVNFGATAKGANMQVENAVGVLQALAATGIQAAEAGTALNAVILRVQASGKGYRSGQFNFVEGLQELQMMAEKMRPRARDSFIEGIFGKNRYTEGRYLLEHTRDIERFTQAATGTAEASKAANIANQGLSRTLTDLAEKWKTLITTSSAAGSGVDMLVKGTRWLTENLNTIVSIGVPLIATIAGIKALTLGAAIAVRGWAIGVTAYNFAVGLATPLTGALTGAMLQNRAATLGAALAMKFLGATIQTQIALTGGVLLALGLLVNMFREGSDEMAVYNEELGRVEKQMAAVKKPIDAATIAIQEHNRAIKEAKKGYEDLKVFEEWQKYAAGEGLLTALRFNSVRALTNPVLFTKSFIRGATGDSTLFMPSPTDTLMPEPADTVLQRPVGGQPTSFNASSKDTAVTVYLNVDKSGNVDAKTATAFGAVPVIVKQTGGTPFTANA